MSKIILPPISVDPFYNHLLFKNKTRGRFKVFRGALDIILRPADSFPLHEDLKAFSVASREKVLFYPFSFGHKSIETFGLYPFLYLVREFPSGDGIVFVMCRKRKRVQLGDSILGH